MRWRDVSDPLGGTDGDSPLTGGATTTASDAVAAAFVVGWRLAELYDREALPPPTTADPDAPLPRHLPGASEMSEYEKARVNLDQAQAALRQLTASLGAKLPTLEAVGQVLGQDGHPRDDVRREILSAYVAIRDRVAGLSPLAASSCGLGRMLADTTLLPHAADPTILLERFAPYRLANAYRWLDDLSTSFSPKTSAAIAASLRTWETWVAGLKRQGDSLQPSALTASHIRRLRAQGEMWRRLVAGEVVPKSLLGSDDYVAAGERLLGRSRQIAARFLRRWWFPAAVLLGSTGAAVWAAVTYAPAGSTRVAAVLVSLAGALGVSWKTVSATLGRALSQAESALWDSEVVTAIGEAATVHPTTGTGVSATGPTATTVPHETSP